MDNKKGLKPYRDRKFCLLLYPEDESHVQALEHIKQNFDYAFILHNRDVNEFCEIKKAHWHVVFKLDKASNPRWNTAIAEELGITANYIQPCRKLDNALLYLIHFNDPDKIQYDVKEVQGTLKKRLKLVLTKDDKTEGEKVSELISIILQCKTHLNLCDFTLCAVNLGYYDVLRRSSSLFQNIIKEHNLFIDATKDYEADECLNDF